MRLHHLQVTAFGPFADTVAVDFDELGAAGLFLLTGATGAGKTSVLDAVCFALYGDVPGDRGTARRLRCDRADDGVAPRVELEATLAGRRFRLVRSPSWQRPKKRGTGTTAEQAHVTISERLADGWTPLSSRIDETGDLVTRLLGLTLTQFTQVAMLPQGRFQAFLRASSDERHKLLQQLFRTGRFEAVEQWLRDHRAELRRADAAVHREAADLVSRASESAGTQLPDDWDPHQLGPLADDGTLPRWLDRLLAAAREEQDALAERLTHDAAHEAETRTRLEATREAAARHERAERARAELADLEAHRDDHETDLHHLDAARRAAGVSPLSRLAGASAAAAQRSDDAVVTARHRLVSLAGTEHVVPDDLLHAALAAAATARAVRPRADRLTADQVRLRHADGARRRLAADLERLGQRAEQLPARVAELRADLGTTRDEAALVESLTVAAQTARARLDAHGEVEVLRSRLRDAETTLLTAREHTVTLREELVALRLARIDGMAAELATALVVGESCPVCGSAEHPHRARPHSDAPDAAAERAAQAAIDDAAAVEHLHDQAVRDLQQNLAVALARAGEVAAPVLADELGDLQERLGTALRAAGRLPDLEQRHADAETERDRVDGELRTLAGKVERAETEHDELARGVGELEAEIDAVLQGHTSLAALVDHHDAVADAARAALDRQREATGARAAADEAAAALDSAAREAGFDSPAAAVDAALEPASLARLAESVRGVERRREAAEAVLAETPVGAEGAAPGVLDLALADAEHDAALEALTGSRADAARATHRAARLADHNRDLARCLERWLPLRRDLAVAAGLASFADGTSPDNELRMRLSAYVLAYRLGQVVDAANERLAGMTDRRYCLEHTGRRGAGETRGGLSLLVRDDWSGRTRDPATLSGGETFVVSLALALGLADVIAHEAGGAALDTLFVDEGFGSLDADTLDDVLDTLDALRDGGRVVGVVSHVAEMRDRIPTQLVVATARRGGSTLTLRR